MDRWTGILRVVTRAGGSELKTAASLCISRFSGLLSVPSTNVLFFTGDRVEGSGDPLIEELSDAANIAHLLVSKLSGGRSVPGVDAAYNVWVVDASTFHGPFAVYKEFVPSVDSWGNPTRYDPEGFPASISVTELLSSCVQQARDMIASRQTSAYPNTFLPSSVPSSGPRTIILGFSKGGIILNQILTEIAGLEDNANPLSHKESSSVADPKKEQIVPLSHVDFLKSISEIHYVDVGLSCVGAYLNNRTTIKKVMSRIHRHAQQICFVFHGTPRQWSDKCRPWIRKEEEMLVDLLKEEARINNSEVAVEERFYFQDQPRSLKMHFEIIKEIDLR